MGRRPVKFQGQLVVITGGSSGLGKALALRLAQRGARLALIARDGAKLAAARAEILAAAPEAAVHVFSCDVADWAAVEKTFAEMIAALGPPEVLINSAGILRESYFQEQSLATFREVMGINYFGTLHCIQAALPAMEKQGRGRIVNICSMAGKIGAFGYAAYCSSKHAVAGLTEVLRHELRPRHVLVQIAFPPEFDSPMVDELNTYRTRENQKMVQTLPVLGLDGVADAVLAGMDRDAYAIVPGAATRLVERLNRWWPGLARAAADARLKRYYRGPGKGVRPLL